MFASVARFQRQEKVQENPKKETEKGADRVKENQTAKVRPNFSNLSHSYISVLNGGVGKKENGNNLETKTITLTDHELVNITNSLEVALVKAFHRSLGVQIHSFQKAQIKISNFWKFCNINGKLSPSSFDPQVVSIGPLHKRNEKFQDFEERKVIYLHEFLSCLNLEPDLTFKSCVQKVIGSIEEIKACYGREITYNDTEFAKTKACYGGEITYNDFAKMMVIDGCFVLYFFYSYSRQTRNLKNPPPNTHPNEFLKNPPALATRITYDLLGVENQIPLFVLKDIFECTISENESFNELILPYLTNIMPNILGPDPIMRHVGGVGRYDDDHILGLLHKSYQASYESEHFIRMPKFHSAVELDRAGVSFEPNNKHETSLTGMKLHSSRFSFYQWPWCKCKPTLRMPVLRVDDATEMVLRNLIAYEQSSSSSLVKNYITSYAYAMHMLIHTPDDVAVLVKSKVIDNILASNDRAADILKNICKETVILDFFYHEEWEKLDKYYNSYWPKHIAGLKRTYFNNPWNMIALFAGIVLFILTLVQTIFTVTSTTN
ncbi:hypothetical protein CTI12_AA004180 [Artemisia annua]|uniref:Uncharacterized protein n=1 Tax=Artemisia annua TaxID=35608 RepID=A0A2U1QNT0_ARTAN|nr:hypothetical protein CTI12_AA004180 [Artemisia annua]